MPIIDIISKSPVSDSKLWRVFIVRINNVKVRRMTSEKKAIIFAKSLAKRIKKGVLK